MSMNSSISRRYASIALLIAVLLSPFAGIALYPKPVQAVSSADPNDEIVYIDRSGVIQVLDTQGVPPVQWYSPSGDWKDAALGDVNDDGDMEIVAIGRTAQGNTKIAVFDPVIGPGGTVVPGQTIPEEGDDAIPWDTLYYNEVAGSPEIVQSANFDDGIPGDELLYSYGSAEGPKVVIMNAASLDPNTGKPTGRDWKEHVSYIDDDDEREWRFARAGDVNNKGSDEAVLVDSQHTETRFDVFDVDQGFLRIDGKNSDNDTIRKVAVGQIIEDGGDEVTEIRTTKPGSDALKVYKWDSEDAELSTDEAWAFSPQPEFVFLADLDGGGDKEVVFLRKHPDDNGARLIMLDEWGDDQENQLDIEDSLEDFPGGVDNEFKLGVGGDVDGDLRDEIIIASSSRIIVFVDPHPGGSISPSHTIEFERETNNDTLLAGDLDANGFTTGPIFGVDKELIQAGLPLGTSAVAGSVTVSNIGAGEPVDVSIVGPLPAWVKVNPMAGITPQTFTVTFDATNEPVGSQKHTLQLTSTSDVTNKPYSIELEMTVEPAAMSLQPSSASFVYFPCDISITDTVGITEPMQMTIDVGGTAGLKYEAAVIPVPELAASAQVPLQGNITGGEITADGAIVLYDDTGASTTLPALSAQAAGAQVSAMDWPNFVPWITEAASVTNTIPSSIELTVNPVSLGTDFTTHQALMILIADSRAGSPPDNIEILPITMMCAQSRVMAPTILR